MDHVPLAPPMVAVQDAEGQWRLWLASDLDGLSGGPSASMIRPGHWMISPSLARTRFRGTVRLLADAGLPATS